ncbi:hypothetical protein LINPERHAP2_LOCUS32498 [Linum perenne]
MDRPTKSALTAILLLAAFSAVANGLADTRVVKGPTCDGKSKDIGYDTNASILVTKLVNTTPGKRAGSVGEYRYNCSYPNGKKGSATGGASCSKELGRVECLGCLLNVQNKLMKCHSPIAVGIELRDCKLWFKKI